MYRIEILFESYEKGVFTQHIETCEDEALLESKANRMLDYWIDVFNLDLEQDFDYFTYEMKYDYIKEYVEKEMVKDGKGIRFFIMLIKSYDLNQIFNQNNTQ